MKKEIKSNLKETKPTVSVKRPSKNTKVPKKTVNAISAKEKALLEFINEFVASLPTKILTATRQEYLHPKGYTIRVEVFKK